MINKFTFDKLDCLFVKITNDGGGGDVPSSKKEAAPESNKRNSEKPDSGRKKTMI